MQIELENDQIALLATMNEDGTADFEIVDNFEQGLDTDFGVTMYSIMFGFIGAQMMNPDVVQDHAEAMIDWWNEQGQDFNELLDNPINSNCTSSPKLEVIEGGKNGATNDTDGG